MANSFIHPSMVAAEFLTALEDNLVIGNLMYRDKTVEFDPVRGGQKVGDTISIRTRPEYKANEFSTTITVQDVRESTRSLTIEKHFDTSIEIGAKERALDLDSFSSQVIVPAAINMAEVIDTYLGAKITQAAGLYSSATLFSTAADMAQARKVANKQQIGGALGDRYCIVNADLEALLLGYDYFNTASIRGDGPNGNSLTNGVMGRMMGIDFFSSLQFPEVAAHTAGTGTSTTDNTSSTLNAIGTSALIIDALTGQIEAGDRIAVAGARRPLIAASQVLAAATSIPLVDPISEVIDDGAAVTVVSSTETITYLGAIFNPGAFAYAVPGLDPPSGVESSTISANGFSIRVVSDYDISTKKETMSLDLIIGGVCWDPRRVMLIGDNA